MTAKEAAKEYAAKDSRCQPDFIAGANWQKEQDFRWHDLRKNPKDLPKVTNYRRNCSDDILLYAGTPDGEEIIIGYYDYGTQEWNYNLPVYNDICIVGIAWMELPGFNNSNLTNND